MCLCVYFVLDCCIKDEDASCRSTKSRRKGRTTKVRVRMFGFGTLNTLDLFKKAHPQMFLGCFGKFKMENCISDQIQMDLHLVSVCFQDSKTLKPGCWPRPPVNYCILIALALKSSHTGSLKVQQIYNFTRSEFNNLAKCYTMI